MKKISRLFLYGAVILMLLTAACAAEEGTTPTLVGTSFPEEATNTPFGAGGTAPVGTAETVTTAETATTLETATAGTGPETSTPFATDSVSTQPTAVGGTVTGATQTPGTPGIPVTGPDIVLVECQFCVDTMAHALLVLPDTATFEITSPTTTTTTSTTSVAATDPICTTVEVNNGRQVVLCSGPEMTPITLNICTSATTCVDFPVDLLACPLTQAGTAVPDQTQDGSETAVSTLPATTSTPTSSVIISTPTP